MACMYTIFTLLTTRIQVHVEVDCAFLGNVSITVTDVMQRKIKVHFVNPIYNQTIYFCMYSIKISTCIL